MSIPIVTLTKGHPITRPFNYLMIEYWIMPKVRRLFNDDQPPDRSHFSWSLPLALKLGENFMSTSMVALPRAFSITRPASRARRWC